MPDLPKHLDYRLKKRMGYHTLKTRSNDLSLNEAIADYNARKNNIQLKEQVIELVTTSNIEIKTLIDMLPPSIKPIIKVD